MKYYVFIKTFLINTITSSSTTATSTTTKSTIINATTISRPTAIFNKRCAVSNFCNALRSFIGLYESMGGGREGGVRETDTDANIGSIGEI